MMQLRWTDNMGDVVVGILAMCGFIVGIGYLAWKLRQYNTL
jgi:hypothetical protein